MQKTKLILKAKAHGAYNKAKKVYMSKVKNTSYNDGVDRQSERLRHEAEILRAFSELFEAMKRAFFGMAQTELRRNMSTLTTLFGKHSSLLGEEQSSFSFLLDAMASFADGVHESAEMASKVFERAIPSCLDGFMSVELVEAKSALNQFERASKNLADSEARLANLKSQAKPDFGVISQQEEVVQQDVHDLDRCEDRAYDTLFRVNEEAQVVLIRCLSQFLSGWAEFLASAAANLSSVCDSIQAEKMASGELKEFTVPNAPTSARGEMARTIAESAFVQPMKSPPSEGPRAPYMEQAPAKAPSEGPKNPYAEQAAAKAFPLDGPRHPYIEQAPAKSPPVKMGFGPKQAPKQVVKKNSSGNMVLAKKVPDDAGREEAAKPAPVASSYGAGGGGFLQPANPYALQAPSSPKLSSVPANNSSNNNNNPYSAQPGSPKSSSSYGSSSSSAGRVLPPPPGQQQQQASQPPPPSPGGGASAKRTSMYGRQRVEKEVVTATTDNEFARNCYYELGPSESRKALSRMFVVKAGLQKKVSLDSGKERMVQLSADVERKSLTLVEPMMPQMEVPMRDVMQFYKATKHPTRLVLRLHGRAKERYEFSSVEERERFVELMWSMYGIPLQPNITVFVSSFNLGEQRGPENLENWIPEGYDVYAVGTQECEYIPHRQFDSVEADLFAGIQKHLGADYIKIAGQSLLSIRLIVLVKRKYAAFCTNVKMRKAACGIGKKVGNKGGVAVTFSILQTRFCFLTAHMAAHDEKYDERNQDYHNIALGLRSLVPAGMSPLNYYHAFFYFGDFNYRVEMPREQVLHLCEQGQLQPLLARDQLSRAITEGIAFHGFSEGPINFIPTYRVLRGKEGFSDDKMRIPSWTDRVLWRNLPAVDVRLGAYGSCPAVRTSDHRPVWAAFQVQLFKPNLPHQFRCNILLTGLEGELNVPQLCLLQLFSVNLLDPQNPPETSVSGSARWGDFAAINPISCNPSFVSARHLMVSLRTPDRRETIGSGAIPLAPACVSPQVFRIGLHDEQGVFMGNLKGTLHVVFAPPK